MTNFRMEKLNTVVIPVRDLEESIEFYHNVLHLHKGYVDETMAYFSFGDADYQPTILLHRIDEREPVEKGITIEFKVDDVIAAVSFIKNAGGKIVQEPTDRDWGVKEAVIADPDG